MGGDTAESRPLVRLPLQVGTTAHWSFARVPAPIALGVLVGDVVLDAAGAGDLGSSETLTGVLLLALLAALCIAYGGFHLRGAFARRASDILITSSGIETEGGPGGGMRARWGELSPPHAVVEETSERQLTVVGSALFVLSLFRAAWPLRSVTIWKLWIHVGQQRRLVAVSDRPVEAESMRSAAQTIAAIEEGRRYAAEAPHVAVETVHCPSCGAPAIPHAAEAAPCRHCGEAVPMTEPIRRQAAAAKAVDEGHERARALMRRLLRQPRARATNHRLGALWLLMVIPWPMALVAQLRGAGGQLVWALPLLVTAGAYALGRAALASRTAMQLLTLGFGALAPEREGDAPRCRRCHGPLRDAGAAGIVRCGYCQSDNVTGIDLRPVVDAARTEQQTVDAVFREQRRARARWRAAAAFSIALACFAAVALVVYTG